jgi:hypothetical protein
MSFSVFVCGENQKEINQRPSLSLHAALVRARPFLRTVRPQPHPVVTSALFPPRVRIRRLGVGAESRHAPFAGAEVA